MSNVENTLQERGNRYGEFTEQGRITQNIKRAMRDSPNWESLTDDKKEALDMIASKISRVLNGDSEYWDSWHDIAGYATLAEKKCATKKGKRMNDQAIEQEIQDKGLAAPRITPADIEANIASEHYFTAADGAILAGGFDENKGDTVPEPLRLLTFCVLVLRNGFTVTGESACASPENFDAELGRKIASQNAVSKVWPLMGYALKDRLYKAQQLRPTYFVKHPDDSYSVADPQPV